MRGLVPRFTGLVQQQEDYTQLSEGAHLLQLIWQLNQLWFAHLFWKHASSVAAHCTLCTRYARHEGFIG
jgi:hypothetical protein